MSYDYNNDVHTIFNCLKQLKWPQDWKHKYGLSTISVFGLGIYFALNCSNDDNYDNDTFLRIKQESFGIQRILYILKVIRRTNATTREKLLVIEALELSILDGLQPKSSEILLINNMFELKSMVAQRVLSESCQ